MAPRMQKRLALLATLAFLGPLAAFASTCKTALLVIDMQPGFVTRGGNENSAKNKLSFAQLLAAQVEAIRKAKQHHAAIVFLEFKGNYGPTNEELKKAVGTYPNAEFFTKDTDGAFNQSNSFRAEFIEHLKKEKVCDLVVTGANGGACVEESIKGAIENCYNVTAVSEGIADFNFETFIYPYADKYKFKPKCEGKFFREVTNAQEAFAPEAPGQFAPASSPVEFNESTTGTTAR